MAQTRLPDSLDLSRLAMAMQRSRLVLRKVRENRTIAVRQAVGAHWSEHGSEEKVPVNLIAQYQQIVGRNLVAKNPRVNLSTFERSQKPIVSACETWVNKEIEELRLANTLQRVVVDALYSIGICKVALGTPADAARMSWNLRAGSVFAERVDLDDFVFDIHARDFQESSYIGHRFRVPLDAIRHDKAYSDLRLKLEASYDPAYNPEGDERISMLGRTFLGIDSEEFEDHLDLWEVYLPRHRLVVTLADDSLTGAFVMAEAGTKPKALKVQKWLGPDSGPYHILGFGVVPGNAMPKAPIQDLIDLHMLLNNIWRKLDRQAERQKEVALTRTPEEGQRIIDASDGEMIRSDQPENTKVAGWGGPNQGLLAMFQQTFDIANRMAGNLELMGGAAPQSKTLGQDRMLEQNASGQISDMQDVTVNFVSDVCRAMMWYWWHDPYKVMKSKHSLPGMPQFSIQRQVTPQQRQTVPFDQVDIRVDPYSLRHQTPQERMTAMNSVVTTIIIPMMQLLQQQGINFDANAYLQKVGQYLDQPDLAEILTIMEPPQQTTQGSGGGSGPAKPGTTTRNYNRQSSGQPSRYGMDLGRLNAMGQRPNGQANGQTAGGVR